MAGLDTHSDSPISSKSSQESLKKDKDTMGASSHPEAATPAPDAATMEDVPLVLDSESQTEQPSEPFSNPVASQRPRTTIPRLDTRKSAVAAPLPWKIDETSSPYTPTSHSRKPSFAPPPRASYKNSVDVRSAASPQPKLSPLSTTPTATASSSPYTPASPYTHSQSSSPYSNSGTNSHTIDLSHPPGYTQHSTPFTDRVSTLDSPSYTNHSPFYSNSSYSSSISSPLSPTARARGRGILDNDPSIYLSGEADGDEETMWDTAAKWAKAAGKRLSAGEQTIWKMVNAMGPGDDRP